MKKITSLVCLFLCIVLLCTSCAKDMTFVDYYAAKEYKDKYPTLNSFTEVEKLDGYSYETSGYEIIVVETKEGDKVKFFNLEKDYFVLTIDEAHLDNFDFFEVSGNTFIVTVEADYSGEDIYYTNIYDANGSLMFSKKGYSDLDSKTDKVVITSEDLFQFDKKIYRVDNGGGIYPVVTNPFYGTLPAFSFRTEAYYYIVNSSDVAVYDQSLNCVFNWTTPYITYEECSIVALSEENFLVQILEVLPDTETKYDFLGDNGEKYKLTSTIVDVKTGKEKTVKLDYLITYLTYSANRVYGSDEYDYISDKISNIAYVCYIKDHKLHSNISAFALVALSGKDASVEFTIAPEFDNLPTPIAENRFEYITDSGETYLIDATGKTIAKFSSDVTEDADFNEKYIVLDGKIYNYDLNEVYDCAANKKEVIDILGHCIILRDSVGENKDYHLYTVNGEVFEIENFFNSGLASFITGSSEQFYTTFNKDDTEFKFYNEFGTYLGKVDNAISWRIVYEFDDNAGVIIAVVDASLKVSYYKISK